MSGFKMQNRKKKRQERVFSSNYSVFERNQTKQQARDETAYKLVGNAPTLRSKTLVRNASLPSPHGGGCNGTADGRPETEETAPAA
jgi:hypothetical protein